MLKNLFKHFKELFKVDWINTIRFNFNYFSIKEACKLPVFLYNAKLIAMKGKVILTQNPRPGMIKLGKLMVPTNQDSIGITYENQGGIVKLGRGEIGSGSQLMISNWANLQIGKNFHITSRLCLLCSSTIKIGDNCLGGGGTYEFQMKILTIFSTVNQRANSPRMLTLKLQREFG